jgi:peptidoglycan hydrolase CwlO-like protein
MSLSAMVFLPGLDSNYAMKNGRKLFLSSLASLALFFGVVFYVRAQSCGSASECDNLIQQYTQQLTLLQGQAGTLKNQIAQFDAQIKLTTLKITQTQSQIELLGGRINQLEVSLNDLTKAFSSRAVETYKLSKFENNFFFILSASDINDAAQRFHYLQKIEEQDRSLLTRLTEAQTTYQGEKQDQETLQSQLKDQQAKLNTQKVAKNNLLAATQNSEAKYQSLLSQAIAQKNSFLSFVQSHGGASILSNQTTHDDWGYYYNQRDGQWGNSFMGGSHLTMADFGCLVTSTAMMASHYGHDIKPIDIANTPSAFFSPNSDTALLYWQFTVNGTGINLNPHPKSQLDSLLAGGPVIVGLYSGPDHYIVLKSGASGNYIMNDPFLENGGSRNFSEKYTLGNITQVFTVSFN